ncbi:lytic polysaccharide monooxygenase [Melanomma pulvis-pyrius CBS 109.77]|uniref:lytic cellulose monooxygenase (C4-dehydrogenating) n=1 Tax=Melanomma pulvis-pyrius CBS 109.77 TaxID=1314802 RepID=A0A6A6X665_9PLEO|nr:lytic polysaccharide monooxygenase [Melanomma pulvis-pyrius CBS 109.77]
MRFAPQRLNSLASVLSLLLLQGVEQVDGHYGFPVVVINGVVSEWWQYVRPVGPDDYGNYFQPLLDYTGEPQVCGIDGTKTGSITGTAKVEAGSTIGFIAFSAIVVTAPVWPTFNESTDGIRHEGPGQAYMSKAPADLESYTGDGEWFKIWSSGSSDGQHWDTYRKAELNFTIPKTTPPGKYLVRVEHFNISPIYGQTQQYINCAQVEVTGPGGGTPGPTIKFPGGYDPKDSSIWLPNALYQPQKPTELLKNYKGPGPEVWTG